MIPIARETYLNTIKENVKGLAYIEDKNGDIFIREDLVLKAMIEFAKLHVHEALKEATNKLELIYTRGDTKTSIKGIAHHEESWAIIPDYSTIFNAYPDELIK